MSVDQAAITIEPAPFMASYAGLWERFDANSFFRSPPHLEMIAEISRSRLSFAVWRELGQPVAALPFATLDGEFGPVVNALPFYGTCGGVVSATPDRHAAQLIAAVLGHAKVTGCAAVTFVDDWRGKAFSAISGASFITERTNQYIDLGALANGDPLASYHQKTRNLVRKAARLGVTVRRSSDRADIEGLRALHLENMAAINGIPKPDSFFDVLRDRADRLGPWALYVATHDGRDCAYLLNFQCGDTVEYYMPTVALQVRALQPLSLLIDFGIRDSIAAGFKFWNFGGTWPTQESLRHFKTRWGGLETDYQYHTFIMQPELLRAGRQRLLASYPYFFIAPFDQIAG